LRSEDGKTEFDRGKRYCLMCPGPVNVSARVLEAMMTARIGHREEEFSVLLREIRRHCLELMTLPEEDYRLVVVTGSGSAANESVLCSAIGAHEVVLSLETGEFGRRLGEVSSVYNPETIFHKQAWGTTLDLEAVASILETRHVDWVTMVHHETSTGELQPVREVGALCKRYGVRLFVDAVSSFMADPLDLASCHVTMMTTSSGKALGMPPGIALVVGEKSAFEHLQTLPVRNHYLNLARHYEFLEKLSQTPNTPSIALFVALHEALLAIREDSVAARYAAHAQRAEHLRAGLRGMGLKLLRQDAVLSNAVSSIVLPAGVSFEALRDQLRQRGFIVYGGKGPLKDVIFQVSTMGDIDAEDIDGFLSVLREILSNCAASVA